MLPLEELQQNQAYFDPQGRPTPQFVALWQAIIDTLKAYDARLIAGGL